jgi:hypothetical protein
LSALLDTPVVECRSVLGRLRAREYPRRDTPANMASTPLLFDAAIFLNASLQWLRSLLSKPSDLGKVL